AVSLDDLQRSLGTGPATDGLVEIFLSSLDDDAQQLRPLLKTANRTALRQWAHRTGGALALLRSPSVDAEMQAFRHAMQSAADADLCAAGERVMRLL
ncbi:Hpt domain-containing protein, partial [Acinetobacter baumannii]